MALHQKTKKFLNSPEDAVDESLRGTVLSSEAALFHEKYSRVVLRSDLNYHLHRERVSLIAGGGSGHEPYAAGYVGRGFLTAAVAGNIFASPPSKHVQAALQATKGAGGAILFVINYTGDRLNFGLAAERFKAEGGVVEIVTIGDDVAIKQPSSRVGRRGLAGAILIEKIAGAMAETNSLNVHQIAKISREINDNLGTFGVSLYPCSLPGKGVMFRLGDDEMEIGLGIHGEPGKQRTKVKSAKEIVTELMASIVDKLQLKKNEPICVLLNNLGSVSQLEMSILTGEIIQWACDAELKIERFYSGALLTSLDGHGVSITLLRVYDKNLLSYLDAPTNASAWKPTTLTEVDCAKLQKERKRNGNEKEIEIENDNIEGGAASADAQLVKRMMDSVCEEMHKREDELNELDSAAGDGDTGSTFVAAAKAICGDDRRLDFAHPNHLLRQLSEIFEESVGGTSGALYALMLSTAATELKEAVSNETCAAAVKQANEAVQKYGGARPGDRSMADALNAASNSLAEEGDWKKAVEEAMKAAKETAGQKASVGRASYTNEQVQTQPDAGAMAIAYWLQALWKTVAGN